MPVETPSPGSLRSRPSPAVRERVAKRRSDDPRRQAVLRTFLAADGRLTRMPAKFTKRRYVLEHIVCAFEPGAKYSEVEVNAILRAFYDDCVTLRRYLIDADLMAREDGVYWRTGGYVAV